MRVGANVREDLRVFLDANILFSASLKAGTSFDRFWMMRDLVLLTSPCAADEVRRNCVHDAQSSKLEKLLLQMQLVSDAPGGYVPSGIVLPAKDAPILSAAIHAGADFLITGDRHHFRRWMNLPIQTHLGSLVIQEPARFLDEHLDRL